MNAARRAFLRPRAGGRLIRERLALDPSLVRVAQGLIVSGGGDTLLPERH